MSNTNKKSHTNKDFSIYPSKKILFILIAGAILMLFFAVFLFTRPAFNSVFNLSDKGPIGDAINGITGPIIALISAGLLFYSFQAQLEANKRQLDSNKMLKSQWEFDTYYRLYGEIEKAYDGNLRMTTTTRGVDGEYSQEYIRGRYIEFLSEEIDKYYLDDEEDVFNQFLVGNLHPIEFILEDIIVLINYVRASDVAQKQFFLYRINRFYNTCLEKQINELYNKLPKTNQFSKSLFLYGDLVETITSIRENELKFSLINPLKYK